MPAAAASDSRICHGQVAVRGLARLRVGGTIRNASGRNTRTIWRRSSICPICRTKNSISHATSAQAAFVDPFIGDVFLHEPDRMDQRPRRECCHTDTPRQVRLDSSQSACLTAMLREENFVHMARVAVLPHNSFDAGDLKRFDGHRPHRARSRCLFGMTVRVCTFCNANNLAT
jgi:hypothetical protein